MQASCESKSLTRHLVEAVRFDHKALGPLLALLLGEPTGKWMLLRLTIVQDTEARTVIRVDGRLAGEGSDQLDEACAGRRQGLVLDLQNLMTIDDVGLATLRRFAGDGVELRNTSQYVSLLLGKMV